MVAVVVVVHTLAVMVRVVQAVEQMVAQTQALQTGAVAVVVLLAVQGPMAATAVQELLLLDTQTITQSQSAQD
jgi:hypothetical protein